MTINVSCRCSNSCAESKDFKRESRSIDSLWLKCNKCGRLIQTKKEHYFVFRKPFRKEITLDDINRIFYADYANHVKRRNERLCEEASVSYLIRSQKKQSI